MEREREINKSSTTTSPLYPQMCWLNLHFDDTSKDHSASETHPAPINMNININMYISIFIYV